MTKNKSNSLSGIERRTQPRVNKKLALKVAANGYDFSTSTKNISCIGAYCHITKYIPPFTKVLIRLSLPMARGNKVDDCDVACKGVIVRTEDGDNGGFNIAVYFNEIRETERKKISRYVEQLLPKNTPVLQKVT